MNFAQAKRIIIDFIKYKYMLLVRREITLTLNGGLGDVVLDTQFFYKIKQKYPNKRLIVYFRDNIDEPNKENFSWGKTRHYQDVNGALINPIVEWLEQVKSVGFIDDYIGTNIDIRTYGVRVFPECFNHFFEGYLTPKEYKSKILNPILSNYGLKNYKETSQIAEFKKSGKKIISLHLRRNSSKILDIAASCDNENTLFILLGATEHQVIPRINLINTISLIDSYSKNLGLLDVLCISFKSDFFIGGRGGFELCHWLNCTPSLNVFDQMGFQEIKQGWWDPALWKENPINRLFSDQEDVSEIKNYLLQQEICQ